MPNFSGYRKLLVIPLLVSIIFLLRNNDLSVSSLVPQGFQRQLVQKDEINMYDFCRTIPTKILEPGEDDFAGGIVEKIRGANPLVRIINERDLKNKMAVEESQNAVIDAYYSTMTPIILLMWLCFFVALYCYFGLFCTARGVGKKYFRFFWVRKLGTKKKYLDIFSFLLLTFLIFFGMAGLGLTGKIVKNTNSVLCTWHYFLTDMEQGSADSHWLGLIPLSNLLISLNDFVSLLEQETEDLKSMSRDSINPYSHFINKIAGSAFLFSVRNISRADPSITEEYLPDFIVNFGRLNQPVPTDAQKILNELNFRDGDVRRSVSRIFADFHIYLRTKKENLSRAISVTSNVTNSAMYGVQSLTSFSRGYIETIKTSSENSQPLLKLTFLLLCGICAFSILFWCLLLAFKTRIVTCLNMGWWLLSGLSILGWIVSLVIIPTNIRFMESCGALKKSIDDPVFFNKTMDLFVDHSSSVNQYLYTCIHGNADIPSTFDLYEPTKKFTELYSDHMLDALGIILKDFPTKSTQIPALSKKLESYRLGTLSDSHETDQDLKKLNSHTMIKTNCGEIKDTWVLTSGNCTGPMGTKFTSKSVSDFNVGSPTCIGFSQWMAYGVKNITERYAIKECMDEESKKKMKLAQELVEGFVKNRAELDNLLFEMIADLDQTGEKYEKHIQVLDSFSDISHAIGRDLTALNETLFTPKVGLMSNMKCGVIMKDFQAFQENLCRSLIPTIFEISSVITLISAISTLAACSMFFLSRNIREYDLDYKKVDVYQDFSAYSRIGDEEQDQTNSKEQDEEEEESEDSDEDEETKRKKKEKKLMKMGYGML